MTDTKTYFKGSQDHQIVKSRVEQARDFIIATLSKSGLHEESTDVWKATGLEGKHDDVIIQHAVGLGWNPDAPY